MEEVYREIDIARAHRKLPKENYWIYFKRNGYEVEARESELKRGDWLGFFVEDDTRLANIASIAVKKANWKKYGKERT